MTALDASAVLALVHDEPGAGVVIEPVTEGDAELAGAAAQIDDRACAEFLGEGAGVVVVGSVGVVVVVQGDQAGVGGHGSR